MFRYLPGDPHPISYLRVMLGVEMCRRFYGMGPWDELAIAWQELYPLRDAPPYSSSLVASILPLLPRIVDVALLTPLACFRGQRLADIVDPQHVAPGASVSCNTGVLGGSSAPVTGSGPNAFA